MANQLDGSKRSNQIYELDSIRYLREEDAADIFGLPYSTVLYFAQAAGAVYQFHNNIALRIKPVHKVFGAGFSRFYLLFPFQGFLFECFKGRLHSCQPVGGKIWQLLCTVDLVAPALALIFIEQVIVVFPCPFIEVPLVLEGLFLPAFLTAKFIPQTAGKKHFAADFAFPEAQPPVVQAV